MENKIRGSMNS